MPCVMSLELLAILHEGYESGVLDLRDPHSQVRSSLFEHDMVKGALHKHLASE